MEGIMEKLLFVCLGNICRSPAAEGVMKHVVEREGREADFVIDSRVKKYALGRRRFAGIDVRHNSNVASFF